MDGVPAVSIDNNKRPHKLVLPWAPLLRTGTKKNFTIVSRNWLVICFRYIAAGARSSSRRDTHARAKPICLHIHVIGGPGDYEIGCDVGSLNYDPALQK